MSNVAWRISGVYYKAPTRWQLQNLRDGDYALLTPAPSKADAFCKHWGAAAIYLRYDSDVKVTPICAARELAKEEIRRSIAPATGVGARTSSRARSTRGPESTRSSTTPSTG